MKPLRFRCVAQTQVLSVLCPCPLLSQFSLNPVHNHSTAAQASTTHIPTKTFKERKRHLLICLFTPTFCRNLSAVHSLLKRRGHTLLHYLLTTSLIFVIIIQLHNFLLSLPPSKQSYILLVTLLQIHGLFS